MRILCLSLILLKKSGKSNSVILTTLRAGVSVTGDERIKPNVHIFLHHAKGSVDVVHLVSSHNATKLKTKRWPLNVSAFLLHRV